MAVVRIRDSALYGSILPKNAHGTNSKTNQPTNKQPRKKLTKRNTPKRLIYRQHVPRGPVGWFVGWFGVEVGDGGVLGVYELFEEEGGLVAGLGMVVM